MKLWKNSNGKILAKRIIWKFKSTKQQRFPFPLADERNVFFFEDQRWKNLLILHSQTNKYFYQTYTQH